MEEEFNGEIFKQQEVQSTNIEFNFSPRPESGHCVVDDKWGVVSNNSKILESMGRESKNVDQNLTFLDLAPERLKEFLVENQEKEQITFDSSYFDKNGIEHYSSWSINSYKDNGVTRRSITVVDNTEIGNRANRDFLTGLYNQGYAFNYINNIDSERSKNTTLVIFDLDGLKDVNDRKGHEAGNNLIKDFGGSLKDIFRPGDPVCRIGGDEFLYVIEFPDFTYVNGRERQGFMKAEDMIKGFRERIKNFVDQMEKRGISVSFGVKTISDLKDNLDLSVEKETEAKSKLINDPLLRNLFIITDKAMYADKATKPGHRK